MVNSHRRLGRQEAALTITGEPQPMNMVAAVRLNPVPDPDLLRAALDDAQRRHPALRARIAKKRRSYEFEYGEVTLIPFDVVDGAAEDDWIPAVEAALETRVGTGGAPLLAVALLRGGGTADLIVTIHHAIVDATSATHLLAEVLTTYAELAAEEPLPSRPALPVPAAADDLFPPDHRGARLRLRGASFALGTVIPELRYRQAMRRAGGPRVVPGARGQIYSTHLSADTTAALSRASRRRRVTMASIVQAAALTTLHRHRFDTAPTPMRTMSFPDLRPYLAPPVTAEPLACYISITWQDVAMGAGRDLWAVAGDVQREVEASVRGGARFVAVTMIVPVMRMLMRTMKLRISNVAVSHTGVTALDDRYGPLAVEGLHAFISNTAIGPEFSLRTGVFHGRLTLDVQTLDTDMDRVEMVRLGDGVAALLEEAASSWAGPAAR